MSYAYAYADQEAEEAFAPILAALDRGTSRNRLRQLVYVCERMHPLIEIYSTPNHTVVVTRQHWHEKRGWLVSCFDSGADRGALVGCRCHEPLVVPSVAPLVRAAAAGRRRMVATGGARESYAKALYS